MMDKDILQLMRLNKGLENVVVLDKDKAIKDFKQKMKELEKKEELSMQN